MSQTGNRHLLTVLGLDLAWSGPSGAALFVADEQGQRITPLPSFHPPRIRKRDGAGLQQIAVALSRWIASLVEAHQPKVVAVEVSDWHQPFGRRAGGRERVVQRALGRAEGVALLTLSQYPVQTVIKGAREVKAALTGDPSASKETLTWCIRTLYPQLPPPRGDGYDLYDAAALAHVVGSEIVVESLRMNDDPSTP